MINDFEKKCKQLEDNHTKFKILSADKICIILSKIETIRELAGKWDNINEILKNDYVKSYRAYSLRADYLLMNFQQAVRNDKLANLPELSQMQNSDSIISIPLMYNNSILITHPITIEKYINELMKMLEYDTSNPELINEMTFVHKLVYSKSREMSEFLNKLYSKNDNITIVSSDLTNSIIIKTANKKRYNEIKDTIVKLDCRPRQVLIKALIAEVKIDDNNKYGFEWKIGDKNQQGGYEANLRKEDLVSSLPLAGLKYSLLKGNKFDIFFNMVTQQSAINILSKPQIMTKNNTLARILIGKEVPIVKIESSSNDINVNGNNNSTSLKDIDLNNPQSVIVKSNFSNMPNLQTEYKDVGISLEVIPNISDDSSIMLDIKQIVSEIESIGLLSNPIIKKREASTTVIVNNENTVVIGGMIKKDNISAVKKVPVLSKIPGIGKWLFTSEEKKEESSELLIFITPTIIPNNINEAPETDIENIKIKILNQ